MLSLTLYARLSIFTGSFQLHHAIRAIRFSQSSHAGLMKNFLRDFSLIPTSIVQFHRHLATAYKKNGHLSSVKRTSRLFSQLTYGQAVWSRLEINAVFSQRRWNLILSPFLFFRITPTEWWRIINAKMFSWIVFSLRLNHKSPTTNGGFYEERRDATCFVR